MGLHVRPVPPTVMMMSFTACATNMHEEGCLESLAAIIMQSSTQIQSGPAWYHHSLVMQDHDPSLFLDIHYRVDSSACRCISREGARTTAVCVARVRGENEKHEMQMYSRAFVVQTSAGDDAVVQQQGLCVASYGHQTMTKTGPANSSLRRVRKSL